MADSTAEITWSVLVADDDPSLLNVLRLALRHAGYSVESAPDGAVALEMLENRAFDLLILDILMPGATGWEVLAKSLADTPPGVLLPRAILMTGFNQEYVVDMQVLHQEGVGAMLLKPFSTAELLDEVKRVLASPPKAAPARYPQTAQG